MIRSKFGGALAVIGAFLGFVSTSPASFNATPSAKSVSAPSTTKGNTVNANSAIRAEQRAFIRVFGSGRSYGDGVIPPFHRVKGKTRAALRRGV